MPVRGASLVCGAHGAAARDQRDPGSRSRWRRIWKRRPVRRKDPTQDLQSEALAAATAEYRRLSLSARYDQLAVSGEVNRMIAAAINANPQWFWHGPDA